MYYDPSGNFTILALLISVGLSLTFEVVEDALDGNGMDHDFKDYLGAGISGFFGGLSPVGIGVKAIASQFLFSLAGGLADAAISGDLQENGFWNTIGSIALSSVVSFSAGSISKYVTSKIKAGSLLKIRNNNSANKILGKMGVAGKIGKKTNAALSKMIRNSNNNWVGNIISEYGASSIFGSATSIGWGQIFKGGWF